LDCLYIVNTIFGHNVLDVYHLVGTLFTENRMDFGCSTTFNKISVISGWSVLFVEETGVAWDNYLTVTDKLDKKGYSMCILPQMEINLTAAIDWIYKCAEINPTTSIPWLQSRLPIYASMLWKRSSSKDRDSRDRRIVGFTTTCTIGACRHYWH
jgi:hypothetical protein